MEQLHLGEIIEKAKAINLTDEQGDAKRVCFDFGSAIPTNMDSWRGAYEELALGYELSGYDGDGDYDNMTLEKFIEEIESAVGNTYTGWKGGEFTMNEDTRVWVANRGNSDNTGITNLRDEGWRVIIETGYYEY